jgi:pimeloyl-ACP methyl ester carboxylesterase
MTTTRRVEVGDVTLVVDEAGEGGRPLLLVHGFTGCRDDFSLLIPTLVDAGWHVVAPDLRGHGDSDQPASEDDYGVGIFAGDQLALADALGWDRFALLGHSMGGAIAQDMALRAPGRVDALVLLCTTHTRLALDPGPIAAAIGVVRKDGIARLLTLMAERGAEPLTSSAYERAAARIPGYAERGARNSLRCAPAMYARMLGDLSTAPDRSEELTAISCPVLVAVGEEDPVMVGPSRHLAEVIPGAQLAVIADAGHSPNFENPGDLLAALVPFLRASCP